MVAFVYVLLIVLLLGPTWRMLRILTVIVAALAALIQLFFGETPIGMLPAIVLHSAAFFGLGALIVWLMGPKPGSKSETSPPPG